MSNLNLTFCYVFCKKCGNYVDCKNGNENVYCHCSENTWYKKYFEMHKMKLNLVLDEMEEKVDVFKNIHDFIDLPLLPSPYYHKGTCFPNPRTCLQCWKYHCCTCRSGIGGMFGSCFYKRCNRNK